MTKQEAKKELQKALKKALGFAPSQKQIEIVKYDCDGEFIKGKISAEFGELIVSYDKYEILLKRYNVVSNSELWF